MFGEQPSKQEWRDIYIYFSSLQPSLQNIQDELTRLSIEL